MRIARRGFNAIHLSPRVVERRQDERLSEQAIVELVAGLLVIAVHTHLQTGRELLAEANVVVIRALGFDRAVLGDLRRI